ncbi:MAG TPA: universal stress protein [Chloroflexota bacterium]|nr:universal stress protein [Chloroflexota bacterium]
MQRTLRVPLDGKPLAETALPLAGLLARSLGATLDLVVVVPDHGASVDAPRAYLDRIAGALDGPVCTRLMSGDPGECIVREAAAEHVVMVVMTTHARSGLQRAVLGSVGEYVVAHSPAPTLLVRSGCRPAPELKTILLAIDTSCAAPLATTIELARACSARVVLLRAIAFDETYVWQWGHGPVLPEPQAVVVARQQLNDLAARVREAGVDAEVRVEIGEAATTIVSVAAEVGADVIVMNTHARTGAQRAIQGSVANAVGRMASQPVLLSRLIPPPPGGPRSIDVVHALQRRHAAPAPTPSIPGPRRV